MPSQSFARRAVPFLIAVVSPFLLNQPLPAQTDSERFEKLERAVQELQKRNAELEQEVKSLKARPSGESKGKSSGTATAVTGSSTTFTESKSAPVIPKIDKWKLSTSIIELELYGDARLRYEYRGGQGADNSNIPNDWQERKRERYRLRIGLRGTLAERGVAHRRPARRRRADRALLPHRRRRGHRGRRRGRGGR